MARSRNWTAHDGARESINDNPVFQTWANEQHDGGWTVVFVYGDGSTTAYCISPDREDVEALDDFNPTLYSWRHVYYGDATKPGEALDFLFERAYEADYMVSRR